MRLADFILTNFEAILHEWQEYARTITVAKEMDQVGLRGHASRLLESIANDLYSSQTPQEQIDKSLGRQESGSQHASLLNVAAKQHGVERSLSGFRIGELISEYRALRASVLRLWGKSTDTPQQTDIDDITRFNEAIDQSVAEAVASYSSEKEQQARLFDTLLSSSPDHSCVLDLDGRFIYANRSLTEAFKLPLLQLVGKSLFDLGLERATELHGQLQHVIRTRQPFREEVAYRSLIGENRIYEYIFSPVLDQEGKVEAVAGTARDITERKAADEEIWHNANYDLLTGLPNRRLFHDRVEIEVKHAKRSGAPIALLFIDLDRFKEANDMLGHDVGDLLLRETGRRICSCVRQNDTVARLGGDEFTIILTDIGNKDHVQTVANKILSELAKPFSIHQETVHISGSIGITLFPQDAKTFEQLIKNADQAMYAAKNAGRNRFAFYTHAMQKVAWARFKMIADLRKALPQMQFVVYFQPIVDLKDGGIHKAEALVRWMHPHMGLMLPGEFIGIAEEAGLINEIGNWIFTEAAMRAQEWTQLLGRPFQISINQSPLQLMASSPGMNWGVNLKQLGLDPNSIFVEITEGALLNATNETTEKLKSLHEAGIQLAIDDFGTGYSSMAYLKRFDADFLKIDRSFVHDIVADASSRAIAETIIVMGHKLGLKMIAEGVETVEQRDFLKAAGCDYAQGFLFGQALPAQEFSKLLNEAATLH